MICPMKFCSETLGAEGVPQGGLYCEKLNCAWWNERFGMCCKAVDAFLKGQEDYRAERRQEEIDGRLDR